jgi:hypothetical protein
MKQPDALTPVLARHIRQGVMPRSRFAAAAAWGLVLALSAEISHAARWREVGPAEGAATARVYVDLDSIRQQDGYRIAQFLTIYLRVISNANGIRMDRFTQTTAFDCAQAKAALVSTIAYLNGSEVAQSSENPDWRAQLTAIPPDAHLSLRAYQLACKAVPIEHPPAEDSANSAATVVLPPMDVAEKPQSSAPAAPH